VDIVTITLQAKENSFTNIHLNYAGAAISTRNDVDDAYSSGIVEYYSSYTDPDLEEAYLQYGYSCSTHRKGKIRIFQALVLTNPCFIAF
jgi:hypothetical protein